MKIPDIWKLVIAIVVSEAAGFIGTLFTTPSITTWYAALTHPAFSPPNWVFAPVWTLLYLLIGIAAYLVWKAGGNRKDVRAALIIFVIQLALNAGWSIIFFGQHNPGGALIDIGLLWLAILATILTFYKVSKRAAYLLLPYIAWVTFAAYLNYAIWTLN
jgi:tryptophan-rich sensory protein